MMKQLEGRHAIVTGASRGLGAHIARALARRGVHLALVARSLDELEARSAELTAFGVRAMPFGADLSRPSEVARVNEAVEQRLGPPDILVNNAGVERTAPLDEQPDGAIERAVHVNLAAPMLLARAVLPGMRARGRGHIVNIASMAGKIGLPNQAPYAATKAGLVMFSHTLRAELAREPIGVSVVCPGFVADDGMYARLEEDAGPAPWLVRPTTLEHVTHAVLEAIRTNRAEALVNRLPARPLVVMREAMPGLTPFVHNLLGTQRYARRIHRAREDAE